MSNRAVVILTDPERCELGNDVLVQAVLQVQQLNRAGLPTSQAFCDHPAAAIKFIEAYAKAFPELQLRSSDLPSPDTLYSIVADGRVVPLQPIDTPDAARMGEASQLYPLYVLTLGAPNALTQAALQQNRFIKNDIHVLEIAPVADPRTDPVSVAEAVAREPLVRSSWRDEAALQHDYNEDRFAPSEELASSDPLQFASIDVDFDLGQALNEPGRAIGPVISVADPRSVDQIAVNGAAGVGVAISDLASVTAPAGAAAPELSMTLLSTAGGGVNSPAASSISALPDTTPVAPVTGEAENPGPAPGGDAAADAADRPDDSAVIGDETEPGRDDNAPEGAAPASEPESSGPAPRGGDGAADAAHRPDDSAAITDEVEPGADNDAPRDYAAARCLQLAPEPAAAPKEATEAPVIMAAEEQDRTGGSSFSNPDDDVPYPPSGSFVTDDNNVEYPLPSGGWDGHPSEAVFGGSGCCEVVDLEAVLNGLPEPTFAARPPELEFPAVSRVAGSSRGPDAAAQLGSDVAEPLPEDSHDQKSPVIHDLDI